MEVRRLCCDKRCDPSQHAFHDLYNAHLSCDCASGVELSTAVLSHHLLGPRKKSWGIEMTIATAFMRGAGKNSPLITIPTIRTLMSLGGLAPLPSDALVTPVTFRVKRRGLNGILAESDSQETGARELSGEWVVGKRTWMRLQADWKKGSKGTASPSGEALRTSRQRVVLYVHGGTRLTHHWPKLHLIILYRCILYEQRCCSAPYLYPSGQTHRRQSVCN